MNIAVVSGSTRENSQSAKVSNWLIRVLKQKHADSTLIDLRTAQLPVYDDEKHEEWNSVAEQIQDMDGFILVSPEWNGSASPGMMNFLTFASVGKQKPLAHRPVLIVSVSSGAGGSYPIAQLKAFGNKNNFPVFVPDHLRIRNVEDVLNVPEPDSANESDISIRERGDYALTMLLAYSEKLKEIRDSGVIDLENYRHGN